MKKKLRVWHSKRKMQSVFSRHHGQAMWPEQKGSWEPVGNALYIQLVVF